MCLTCGCMDAHREMGESNITYEDVERAAKENGNSVEKTFEIVDRDGGQGSVRARAGVSGGAATLTVGLAARDSRDHVERRVRAQRGFEGRGHPSTKTLMCSRIAGPASRMRLRIPGASSSSRSMASATVAASTSQRRGAAGNRAISERGRMIVAMGVSRGRPPRRPRSAGDGRRSSDQLTPSSIEP